MKSSISCRRLTETHTKNCTLSRLPGKLPRLRLLVTVALLAGINAHAQAAPPTPGALVTWGNGQTSGVLDAPVGKDFVAIAAGYFHGLALRVDGSLIGWGDNYYGQTNVPAGNDFVAIAAQNGTNLALRSDGSLVG